jgi:hypothetical protein
VPVSDQSRADPLPWAECVVGAITEADYLSLLRVAGLSVEVLSNLDYFAAIVNASTRRARPRCARHRHAGMQI